MDEAQRRRSLKQRVGVVLAEVELGRKHVQTAQSALALLADLQEQVLEGRLEAGFHLPYLLVGSVEVELGNLQGLDSDSSARHCLPVLVQSAFLVVLIEVVHKSGVSHSEAADNGEDVRYGCLQILIPGSGQRDVQYLFLKLAVFLEDVIEAACGIDVFPKLVPGCFNGDHEVAVKIGEEVRHCAAEEVNIVEDAMQFLAVGFAHSQRLLPRLHDPQTLQGLLHLFYLP